LNWASTRINGGLGVENRICEKVDNSLRIGYNAHAKLCVLFILASSIF
jgi:hypothetical protein